ncbi:MAG: hypothetical protein LAO31_20880 [Acidobacteriia bacterium]|nr:hypothetical protein [Terriglobia bacterium]
MLFSCHFRKAFAAVTVSLLLLCCGLYVSSLYAQMGGGGMGGGGGTGNMPGMGSGSFSSLMTDGMGGMMLLSGGRPFHSDGTIVTLAEATDIARRFVAARNQPNLALDEIEEWEYNFYVVVKETDSSNKAFQLVIDKWTGGVMPEPGPNMMWNAKYFGGGIMRGEMMGGFSRPNANMTVTPDAAALAANQFLGQRFAPARRLAVATPPDSFHGYYCFDVNDVATGKKYGMLSVNGTTGQVWYHTWHGNFIQGQELN